MNIQEIQEEIIEEFSIYDDWMEKYNYLIELGKELPIIDENQKVTENLINGCQSKVWLHASFDNSVITFTADSDAIITKGIVALLVRVFTEKSPQEIINAELFFIEKIGLQENLSPTRSNGLLSMIKQIKLYAIAFNAKMNQ